MFECGRLTPHRPNHHLPPLPGATHPPSGPAVGIPRKPRAMPGLWPPFPGAGQHIQRYRRVHLARRAGERGAGLGLGLHRAVWGRPAGGAGDGRGAAGAELGVAV